MWPAFLRKPPQIDPKSLTSTDDEVSESPISKSPKQKHWTLGQLRRKRASLLAQVERETAKEKERLALLEECQRLAQQLEAMKTRTYCV